MPFPVLRLTCCCLCLCLLLDAQGLAAVEAEVRNLSSIRHANIIQYLACYIDMHREVLCIVTELAAGGTLKSALVAQSQLDAPFGSLQVFNWFEQLVSALEAVHDSHLIHRDIKPANIFLTADARVKLGDFGLSRTMVTPAELAATELATTACGTPYYMSPERFRNGVGYSKPADIWSLGCVLYEMLTLRKCFAASSFGELGARIEAVGYNEEVLAAAPHPPRLKALATKSHLLHVDPRCRSEVRAPAPSLSTVPLLPSPSLTLDRLLLVLSSCQPS